VKARPRAPSCAIVLLSRSLGIAFSILAALPARAATAATSGPPGAPEARRPPMQAAVAPASAAPARAAFDHSAWDRLLATYVDAEGRVAYRDLKERDRPALDAYLEQLARANPASWPRSEQIAFWLDAYNAGIVSAVLEGRTPEPALGRVKLFKFWKFRVAGKDRTLDEIEHMILRRNFGEPRIHFALVCASSSCPRLRREAYRADRLEEQLEEQGRDFVNDPRRNVIDPESHVLRLSEIFKWFHEDFEKAAGSVPRFLARYVSSDAARNWLQRTDVHPSYLDYDWTLNVQPGQRPR